MNSFERKLNYLYLNNENVSCVVFLKSLFDVLTYNPVNVFSCPVVSVWKAISYYYIFFL